MKNFRVMMILSLCASFLLLLAPQESAQASTFQPLKAPSNLTVLFYPPDQVKLAWKDNSTDESFYGLNYYKKCPGESAFKAYSVMLKSNSTSFSAQMPYGCQIKFKVDACIGPAGKETCLSSSTVAINMPPQRPSSTTVTKKSDGSYSVLWKDNANNEGMMAVVIGSSSGIKVLGYKSNTTSAAIPASAIPASATLEFVTVSISKWSADGILNRDDFKPGNAIPASALNELYIKSNSDVKYIIATKYIPMILSSNLVTVKK